MPGGIDTIKNESKNYTGSLGLGVLASVFPHLAVDLQGKKNLELAAFQAQMNERYLDKYNEYNLPSNQMRRFQDAGLNPHLIYGSGSPGNQSQPLSYPQVQAPDYSKLMNMIPLINQTRLITSQVQATNASTRQKTAQTELATLQAEVVKKNPLLDETGFNAIIQSLKSTAELKASESAMKGVEADWFTKENQWTNSMGVDVKGPMGAYKLQRAVQLLDQQFKLSELDAKIKAQVINSKEFQNAILEVQKQFMTDGEVTPQHIYQFIQLLLMKIL